MKSVTDTTMAIPPTGNFPGVGNLLFRRARENWARFRRNRLAVTGLVLVVVTICMALIAPLVAPEGPFKIVGGRLRPPGAEFWLGTDQLGRDVLTGVLYGARTSLMVGLLSVTMSLSHRHRGRGSVRLLRGPPGRYSDAHH